MKTQELHLQASKDKNSTFKKVPSNEKWMVELLMAQ